MANEDIFCLRLTEFGSNIKESWQQLKIDKDFCDVTLACNDGQIQSHRIILSHSSPVLKDILKQNSNSNPFMFIRGVEYKSLESLIHFMYQGEVSVSDEDLINFLEVAEDLKVTGLSPEDRDSVTPSYELPEDKGLSNNQNEELHSNRNIHDEKVQQDSREFSFQGKHKRPKSTKLTSDDSIEIDYFRKNNLKDLKEDSNLNVESHSESNLENVEQNATNSEYNRERRSESKHEDTGPSSKRKRTASGNQITNIIENHSVGLLTKFENFFNNEESKFLLQEPKTMRLDMAEDLKVPRLLTENGKSVTPSDELLENIDEVLAINENEDLYGDMDKECIEKSTNNDRDSLVIDNSLHIENDFSGKSKLKYEETELSKEVTHLSIKKSNTQKLVSVKDRKFSCNTCDKQYTRSSHLRRHKALAHEGVRYPCDKCNAGPFTQAASLITHKASAHKGVRYPCDECDAGPYTQASVLRKHKASAHEGVRYPRDECNAGPFTGKSYLRTHKASAHKGVRYPCDECNAGPFNHASTLKTHKVSAHEGVRYPCDKCNAGPFTTTANLWNHKASVHKGVRYPCDECKAGPFTQSVSLRKHKASAHEGVRYPCDQCNAGPFTRKSYLREHKTSAHEGVRYPCDECNAGPFNYAVALKQHKASVHEGVRYSCDDCNAGPFTTAGNLWNHKASAHKGVRYPCDECNAGPFTLASNLRKHKASVHEGVRYPCDECNAGPFSQAGTLKTHKASVHEVARYECNTCDYKATTKGNLKKHCITVHKF